MKRFLVLLLIISATSFLSIVSFLAIGSIFVGIKYFDTSLALFISLVGGLLGTALLNLFSLKKYLIAEIVDNENPHKNQGPISRSYSYDWKQGVIPMVLFLLCITIIVMSSIKFIDNYLIGFIIFFTLALIIIGAIEVSTTRLIISEKGIEYQSLFGKMSGTWDDIIGLMQLIRGDEVLVFQKLSYSNVFVEAIHGDYISISIFDQKWKTGDLGEVIKEFAPHLYFLETGKS